MLARVTPNILKVPVSIVKAINKHQFFKYALECFNGDSKLPWLFIVFDLENKDSIKSKRNKRKSDINLGTQLIWNWTLLKTLCVNETNRCQKHMFVISRFRNSIRNQSVDEKRWPFRFSESMASSNLKFIKMTIRYICIYLSDVSQTYISKWRS